MIPISGAYVYCYMSCRFKINLVLSCLYPDLKSLAVKNALRLMESVTCEVTLVKGIS